MNRKKNKNGANLLLNPMNLQADAEKIHCVHQWAKSAFSRNNPPISFIYDEQPSDILLSDWQRIEENKSVEDVFCRKVSYRCPATGLLLDCQLTTYPDVAAVDWVCYLQNTSSKETPIIKRLLPLDCNTLLNSENIMLRWSNGDDSRIFDSFLPQDKCLLPGQSKRFAPSGGRSSNKTAFPFFNVAGADSGWILAIGWTGQWMAEFTRDLQGNLSVYAGMETTHFRLQPGQQVRTPRIVLLHYSGDSMIEGHNRFRQLMLNHYIQRRNGQPAIPPICHNTAATVYRSKERATESNQLAIIKKSADLGVEAYWMDAYWYPQPWHLNVGNWYTRAEDFPDGLETLGNAAHQENMKFVLWFEPERVYSGTQFDKEYPDFLIKLDDSDNRLFNLGNPVARQFITDFIDEKIKQWKVDIYRQDFNFDPLPYWQENDTDANRGITEMLYVEGLYKFWKELLKRNPGLTIDNCASGGRRIDLETCSYSYPLWRSDLNDIGEGLKGSEYWPRMACADQVHVTGLALYIPFQDGPLWDMHPYSVRSAMTSSIVFYERIISDEFPVELAQQAIAEVKRLSPLFLGNIYPLLPLTANQADWYAYQLDRPDINRGCVFIFRRPDAKDEMRKINLQKIDPTAIYLTSITGETYKEAPVQEVSGKDLACVEIEINSMPGSVLVQYEKK